MRSVQFYSRGVDLSKGLTNPLEGYEFKDLTGFRNLSDLNFNFATPVKFYYF